jgi:2-polyprenyl-6-methoxyphenol hydroxylase-like FAD-dependent oxidoreductase
MAPTAVHESRALVLQPRTLEILAGAGITPTLVERGRTTVRLVLHAGGRAAAVPLFDLGLEDSPYPYLLFLSQAETEAVLAAGLAARGVEVERGAELVSLTRDETTVRCRLSTASGDRVAAARYVVGCDGAGSTVRQLIGVPFVGGRYPHRFALADLEVDGPIEADAVHSYLGAAGMLFLFPLGQPASWRLLGILPGQTDLPAAPPSMALLQRLADEYTGGAVRLRDPAWRSEFRLRHRLAARYRIGSVFLAGDAAHAHSPAGGQGMNAGIQDAWNLGWKIALVARGEAPRGLLDSYEAERLPVGRALLRFTDRLFSIATSTRLPVRTARTYVVPRVAPLLPRLPAPLRAAGFRRVAELDVGYRRSPAVEDHRSGLPHRPRAGDRLPDAALRDPDGPTTLHRLVGPPGYHVLLLGSSAAWSPSALDGLRREPGVTVHLIDRGSAASGLRDVTGETWRRLRAGPASQYAVRPDGHLGFRADGTDLGPLSHWLSLRRGPAG